MFGAELAAHLFARGGTDIEMNIFIPTPLRSYTKDKVRVSASGSTLAAVLEELNRQFPGIRFRMIDEQDQLRPHIKIFVNQEQTKSLAMSLNETDEVIILQALSGG